MLIEWVLVSVGALLAVASTILSQYAISRKNKEIAEIESKIQCCTSELDAIRETETSAKSVLNHYEELVGIAKIQFNVRGRADIDLLATAGEAFLQGMAFRYSAAKSVARNDPTIETERAKWKAMFEKSITEGDASEITDARDKLLLEYLDRNNRLVKDIGQFRIQKKMFEQRAESYNSWNLGFLVLGIIIALAKDLFT